MTNEELLQSAGEFVPEVFEKTAMVMKLTERLCPEIAAEISQDINDILDVTQEKMAHFEKTAAGHGGGGGGGHGGGFGGHGGFGGFTSSGVVRTIGSGAKTIGTGVAVGLGASILTSISQDIYDRATRALSKASNYSAIMKQNPELLKKFDKKELQQSFNTLHSFAPEFTADPQLGAQLLNAMTEMRSSGAQFSLLKDLLNSRKTLVEVKAKRLQPRFEFPSREGKKGSHSLPSGE